MQSLWQDFRYAMRGFRKNRGFSTVAVLILGLGIGANAAIYRVVDVILLRPLPGARPADLVQLAGSEHKGGTEGVPLSYPIFAQYRDNLSSLSGLAAYRNVALYISVDGAAAERMQGAIVSGAFFEVLGLHPRYGRLLTDADDGPRGATPVAVLSERFWRQHFDGRPDAVGKGIRINGEPYTIVGIAPASLQEFEHAPQVWLPLSMAIQADPMMATQIDRVGNTFFKVVGRLKIGVSLRQAQAELDTVSARLGAGQTVQMWEGMEKEEVDSSKIPPANRNQWEQYDWTRPWMTLSPAQKGFGHEESRLSLLMLGVAALVLWIATADVAVLLLVHSEHEEREFAIRAALGASRWSLVRQRMVQGLTLAAFGAIAALFLAFWAGQLLFLSAPENLPLPIAVASPILDLRVATFIFVIACLAGSGFGVLPALKSKAYEISECLKSQRPGLRSGTVSGSRFQAALVVGQVLTAVVLLTSAGLLIRTIRNVARIDLGFDTEHVLSASLDLSRHGYTKSQGAAMLQPLLEKVQSLPGVDSAALRAGSIIDKQRSASWKTKRPECSNLAMNMVSPGYFSTLRIPMLRGRDFSAADGKDGPDVVIVNRAAAQMCWPGADPIGKFLSGIATVGKPFQIVGVVGNVRDEELRTEFRPQIYTSLSQFYEAFPWQPSLNILVRTTTPPHAVISALDGSARSLDSKLILFNVETPRELLSDAYSREEFFEHILAIFGLLALVLAVSGLYGLLGYVSSRRMKEFGIRMVLGAVPGQVFRLVLWQGAWLIGLGVGLGLVIATAGTRFLQSYVFGVSVTDPWTFAAVATVFISVGLVACWLPARRATGVDPMLALRDE
jgi:putative ABC transport system permease protein